MAMTTLLDTSPAVDAAAPTSLIGLTRAELQARFETDLDLAPKPARMRAMRAPAGAEA